MRRRSFPPGPGADTGGVHLGRVPWRDPETVYLGHRRWGFSAESPQQLVITCPVRQHGPASHVFPLPAVNIFEVPMTCTVQTDDWIFQASFRKDSVQRSISRRPPSLKHLDLDVSLLMWNTSGEPGVKELSRWRGMP